MPSLATTLSVLLPSISPRRQWDNAQGFCGETSIQTSALYIGSWISQAVVRAAGGGSEILVCNEPKNCNVEQALNKLGLEYDIFADNKVPTPQPAAFFDFVKAHIDAGHPAIQCIYVRGASDPDYDHIVPVVGYQSSPNRLVFYDLEEDTPSKCIYNVSLNSFINTRKGCNQGTEEYCLPSQTDFAVAITGPADLKSELAPGVKVNVLVDHWDEPDVWGKNPQQPRAMFANISLTGLTQATRYSLLRYDVVSPPTSGFSCSTATVCTNFSSSDGSTLVVVDPTPFESNTAVHWRVIVDAAAALEDGAVCDDACLIACAAGAPACASVWSAPVPPHFTTRFTLQSGATFDVRVDSARAPPMAARFYVLSRLRYFEGGAPFYRVLRNANGSFVSQVGYRGNPSVDAAWISQRTSNETVAVLPPGNVRSSVAFGTSEVEGPRSNCSASACSLGFSVELFVNTADNTRLDAADFSPFGTIDELGMTVVDALFASYGELADLCAGGDRDSYCVPNGAGGYVGVNLTRFLAEGTAYTRADFPKLDTVTRVELL